eukprot:902743_1
MGNPFSKKKSSTASTESEPKIPTKQEVHEVEVLLEVSDEGRKLKTWWTKFKSGEYSNLASALTKEAAGDEADDWFLVFLRLFQAKMAKDFNTEQFLLLIELDPITTANADKQEMDRLYNKYLRDTPFATTEAPEATFLVNLDRDFSNALGNLMKCEWKPYVVGESKPSATTEPECGTTDPIIESTADYSGRPRWRTIQVGIWKRVQNEVLETAQDSFRTLSGTDEFKAFVKKYQTKIAKDVPEAIVVADTAHSGHYNQLEFRNQQHVIHSAHSLPFSDHNHYQPLISGEYNDVSGSESNPLLIGGVVGASAVVIIMLIFCLGVAFGMIFYWGYSQKRTLEEKKEKKEMCWNQDDNSNV